VQVIIIFHIRWCCIFATVGHRG